VNSCLECTVLAHICYVCYALVTFFFCIPSGVRPIATLDDMVFAVGRTFMEWKDWE